MEDNICQIPVTATFTVDNSGRMVMSAAQYVGIPADAIAAYLVDKLGADAIFSGEADT